MHACGRYNRNSLDYILQKAMEPYRPRAAHRLDANTCGLLALAKTRQFAGRMQPQFEAGQVEKIYLVKVKDRKTGNFSEIACDIVLSAAGVMPNIENIGLEKVGIILEKGLVKVDEFYRTNIPGVFAIGDITGGPALAHVASAEGITCVEKMAGHHPEPIDYQNIPSCTYCVPEVASVGMTEEAAKEAGYTLKIGKFPFSASGKASAAGDKGGFVKLIFDEKYGELLGAHLIGQNVTEMVAELVSIRKLETTGHEIIKTIHPHPTMSEAIMEAAAAAYGEVIHL